MAGRITGRRLLWSTVAAGVVAAVTAAAMLLSVRASAAPVPPTRVGINLPSPAYWVENRSFSNLALYGGLNMSVAGGKRGPIDPAYLGPSGWPANVPAGVQAILPLLMPPGAKAGEVIHCSWQGQASVTVEGDAVPIAGNASSLTFSLRTNAADSAHGATGRVATARLIITGVTPAAPMSDVDCREANRPRGEIFDPRFVRSLAPYRVVRFMDWMSVNSGATADFARETLPQRPRGSGNGATLANMIHLAIEAKVDPWFTIPYGATDDYVRRFAQMAHDKLPPERTVYVELGNEMWNPIFIASQQAQSEAIAAGLDQNPNQALLKQYALRSKQMLDIWTKVYADHPSRLVRIVSGKNFSPASSETILSYGNVAKSVDALAVAPYFGNKVYPRAKEAPRPANLEEAFVQLELSLDQALQSARDQKALARRFGKRLIAYEAGQHVLVKNDVPTLAAINRDPRMGKAYARYLESWARDIGDTIVLFHQVGPIGQFGAWGLEEYDGQPLDQAPKKKAVLDFVARHGNGRNQQ